MSNRDVMVTFNNSTAISGLGMTERGELLVSYTSSPMEVYQSLKIFDDDEVSKMINDKIDLNKSLGSMFGDFKLLHPNIGLGNIGHVVDMKTITESEWPGSFQGAAILVHGHEVNISLIVEDWKRNMENMNTRNAWSW